MTDNTSAALTLEQANALVGDDIASWMENPFMSGQMRVEKVLWWLARRDEKRDSEAREQIAKAIEQKEWATGLDWKARDAYAEAARIARAGGVQ